MTRKLPALLFLLIFILPSSAVSNSYDDYGCYPKILLGYDETENALDKKAESAKDSIIYKFYLKYESCNYSAVAKEEIQIKELVILLWGNLDKNNLVGVRLKDESTGNVFPARIEELGKNWLGPKNFKAIIDISGAKLRSVGRTNFSLTSDFSGLKPDSYLYVKFENRIYPTVERVSGTTLPISDVSSIRIAGHYNGNRPPRLLFVDQSKMKTINPETGGLSGESFEFRVRYRDDDGEAPKVAQVWVDINGDGKYRANEKFNMSAESDDRTYIFTYGVDYFAAVRIDVKKAMPVKFRFYFSDGKDEAQNGAPYTDDTPIKEMEIFVGTAVAISAPKFSPPQFVAGETLKVTLPVFHLYRDVEIDWKSIEKNNFKPFRLLYWQIGRHGIKSPEYELPDPNFDFQEITLFLATDEIKTAEVKFPELKIGYKFAGYKKTIQSAGGGGKINRVNFRIEKKISRQLIRIGDSLEYQLKVVRIPSAKLNFKTDEIDFWPLQELKRSEKHANRGSYLEDEYAFTLTSYYMMSKPVSLPDVKVGFSEGKKSYELAAGQSAVAIIPQIGPEDVLMSVWDGNAIAWPKMKTHFLIMLPVSLGGMVIVSVFLFFVIRRLLAWLKVIKTKPKWLFNKIRRHARRLSKKLSRDGSVNEEALIKLLNYSKLLIGLNFGIVAAEAKAFPARELENRLGSGIQLGLIADLLLEGKEMALSGLEIMISQGKLLDSERLIVILRKIRLFLSHVKYLPR